MSNLKKLEEWINSTNLNLVREAGRLEQMEADGQLLLQKKEEAEAALIKLESVMGVVKTIEDSWTKNFEQRIADLITNGLQQVFEEDMEFSIEEKVQGDISVLDFKLTQRRPDGSLLVTDIMGAKGGGVVSIVGFLLRVIVILSIRPAILPVLFVDESFAHLSKDYVPRAAELLAELSKETGIQIVMITHEPEFARVADRVYVVSQHNGVTKYKEQPVV